MACKPALSADLGALEHFLDLSDAELAQLADAIARVRAMTPDQRAALRREVVQFRCLPEAQRREMRERWGAMPPEIQDGWREMMQSTSPEEHAEIQKHMQSLAPADRASYRRRLVEEYLKRRAAK